MDGAEVATIEGGIVKKVIAALYSVGANPSKFKDDFFHASMSCENADIVSNWSPSRPGRNAGTYRVGTLHTVINAGKRPCAKCWTLDGYQAEHDPIARLG
jgi:hypothetical protein